MKRILTGMTAKGLAIRWLSCRSGVGVRRAKAAYSQWVRNPPGDGSGVPCMFHCVDAPGCSCLLRELDNRCVF